MTSRKLLEQYVAERHALGFKFKSDESCIRRFLEDYVDPDNGQIEFTKEYVLSHIGNRRNQKVNTVRREASAINGFMDFAIRKGYTAYKIPSKNLPKSIRNFKAYIFTADEINRIITAADNFPFSLQNPNRSHQIPVMIRILFNCGLRTSELLNLRMCDVNLQDNIFTTLDTKFHKNRLVPFSQTISQALTQYFSLTSMHSDESLLFPSPKCDNQERVYGTSWLHVQFRDLLRMSNISYGGHEKGPRPHDTRHTFAVHCLNRWVLSGEDVTVALPILSRYLGHIGLTSTQKYLQLTAEMYPHITAKLETEFGALIPVLEVNHESK